MLCFFTVHCVDATIRQWPIPLNTKKLILLSYLSYLFRLRLLSRTLAYLKACREQTKQKHTQKQSYKTHPLLPETEATVMFVYFW